MNMKNSETNEPHTFGLTLADKLNLKDPNKNMALANLSIRYTWKNVKSAYKVFITHGKSLSLHITTINLKSLL